LVPLAQARPFAP